MNKLQTTYLGLSLASPIVASASPLSKKVETVKALEEAGAGAVVLYSLFEEQITHESLELDHYLSYGAESHAEAATYLPDSGLYSLGGEKYLDHIKRLKDAVQIPVIGSLNGVTSGGWIEWAQKIAAAGADALELNIYYLADDPETPGAEIEATYLKLIEDVAASIQIPLAVKLSPFLTSTANFVQRAAAAGAKGAVLFNRFYQPDLDIENLEVVPNLQFSTSAELRLPLRWVALLHGRIAIDFALTSGVHTAEDVLKAMMAGAKVTMLASELLQKGPGRVRELNDALLAWMESHDYESIAQMQGSMSDQALGRSQGLRRANYIDTLNSYTDMP